MFGSNGERGRRLGDIFHNKNVKLITSLEYKELLSSQMNIDFIRDPPKGWPATKFVRPKFSPKGRTIFEFSHGLNINLQEETQKLHNKLEQMNNEGPSNLRGIVGGVLTTDIKVSENTITNLMSNVVSCWDFRMLTFLCAKIVKYKEYSQKGTTFEVETTNEYTTLLRCLEFPVSPQGFYTYHVAIFYYDPLHGFNLSHAKSTTSEITNYIINSGTIPAYAYLEAHAAGGFTEDFERNFDKLLKDASDESKVAYIKMGTYGYEVGPWALMI